MNKTTYEVQNRINHMHIYLYVLTMGVENDQRYVSNI